MDGAPDGSAAAAPAPRDRDADGPKAGSADGGEPRGPWFCCSLGHEQLPAACLGVFDEGDQADDQVPYCGDCAQALISTGEYRVTHVLDADWLGTMICPSCAGTGRLPFTPDQNARGRPPGPDDPSR